MAHMTGKMAFVQFIEQWYPLPELSVVLFRMLDELHEGTIPSLTELNDDIPERMAGRGRGLTTIYTKRAQRFAVLSCSGTQDVSVARRAPSNPFCPVAWYPRKL